MKAPYYCIGKYIIVLNHTDPVSKLVGVLDGLRDKAAFRKVYPFISTYSLGRYIGVRRISTQNGGDQWIAGLPTLKCGTFKGGIIAYGLTVMRLSSFLKDMMVTWQVDDWRVLPTRWWKNFELD